MTSAEASRDLTPDADPDRKSTIAIAAAGAFLRYGFRKTSVDDIARAAKLSRQGVYLHFPTKEALFRAAIEYLAERTLDAERSELARSSLSLEDRLVGAYQAMSAAAFCGSDPQNVQELFASAAELAGDVVRKLDEQLVSDFTAALAKERPGRLRATDVGTRALAEHLYVVSYGLKQRGHSGEDYLAQMRVAARIVCKNLGR